MLPDFALKRLNAILFRSFPMNFTFYYKCYWHVTRVSHCMANFASSKNINTMDVSALGQDKEEDDFQLLSAIAGNMDTAAFTRLYGKYAK